ncbi:MAG: 50S ribosomal protein L9 [Candidatus Omnitrophota bacterium]
MEVILRKDIEHLGKTGDNVIVKEGYARNYLIPKGLALVMTQANVKRLEMEKKLKIAKEEKEKNDARELAQKISNTSYTISVETHEQDKLYASVAALDIARVLGQEGISIDKKQILLKDPIEDLGIYDVDVDLGHDIKTKIKVWVVKK